MKLNDKILAEWSKSGDPYVRALVEELQALRNVAEEAMWTAYFFGEPARYRCLREALKAWEDL